MSWVKNVDPALNSKTALLPYARLLFATRLLPEQEHPRESTSTYLVSESLVLAAPGSSWFFSVWFGRQLLISRSHSQIRRDEHSEMP